MASSRVIVITGCSTGIGLSMAVLLARKGFKVYATMRNLDKKADLAEQGKEWLDKRLFIEQLDVCSDESVEKCFKKVMDKEGRIDVLVNNAGIGSMCALEAQSMETWRELMEVNFFGVLRTCKAVLPIMKKSRKGHLINISSQNGIMGVPFFAVYSASKFAVEGLSESLASECTLFGIKVSLIEPGPVKTALPGRSLDKGNIDALDEKTKELWEFVTEKRKKSFTSSMCQTPEEVSEVVLNAIMSDSPHFRYQTNPFYAEMNVKKLNDITGDTNVQMMTARFFKDKI